MSEKQMIVPTRSGFLHRGPHKIYWEYFGQGNREVFCFMNGVAMYTKSWYGFIPLFANDYDILLFDFFGQGESSHEPEHFNMETQCGLFNALLDEQNISKIHLAGVSYGGMAALEFAAHHQNKLHSLTVSGITLTPEELYLLDIYNCMQLIEKAPFDLFASIFFQNIFGEQLARKMKQHFQYTKDKWHERYKGKGTALIKVFKSMFDFVAQTEQKKSLYAAIKTPCLIIAGEEDLYTPIWVQKKALEILPNSRLESMKNVGHVVYMENPGEFAAWCKKIAAAKTVEF